MNTPAGQLSRPSGRSSDGSLGLIPGLFIWLLLMLLVTPPNFDYQKISGEFKFEVSSGGMSGPLILAGSLVVSIVFLLWRSGAAVKLLSHVNRFFVLFVVFATLSVLWSADPAATLRRLFRLYTLVLTCVAFALVGWDRLKFQKIIRPAITIFLAGSIIFGIVSPDLAIERSSSFELAGAWKGLAMQKNSLGALAAMGVVMWTHAWLTKETKLISSLFGLAVSATCVLLSRSSTSLLSSLMSAILLLLMLRMSPAMRPYLRYIVGIFAGVVLIYSLAVLNLVPGLGIILEPIVAITGKDLSFSGRTTIWEIIIESIHRHPLLGAGFGAYWTGPQPTSLSYDFVIRTYIYPTQSHNGYLEVINDLGYVGGFILIAYIVTYLRQSLRLMTFDKGQGALYLTLLFQAFLANLSESHWFSVSQFSFLWMTLATIAIGRQLQQSTVRNVAPAPTGPARQKPKRPHSGPRRI